MQGLELGDGATERLMGMPSHVRVCLGLALETANDVSYRGRVETRCHNTNFTFALSAFLSRARFIIHKECKETYQHCIKIQDSLYQMDTKQEPIKLPLEQTQLRT